MKSIFVFATFLAIASATAVNFEKEAEDFDERTIVSTDSGNFLSTNSTLLTFGVLTLIVVAGAALYLSGGFSAAKIQQRYGQKYNDALNVYSHYSTRNRYKRFAFDDIASKMAQLEQAFKKYQVEEAECEMYIACEASQVQRIEENGPLARIVFDILSTFNREKDGHKWDDRMEGLVKAFEFGTGASASGQVDPCQPLRNKCFELHAKY